ncbi:MAG: glutamate 5-kinase, partial [bacterium]
AWFVSAYIYQLAAGKEIVLVSSGAIYFGIKKLNLKTLPETLPHKQATAAVGQPLLMNYYQDLFDKYDLTTSQVLLTREGIHNRHSYLNASNTMHTLLEMGVIPIVNENDTVATEEIQFGDNDTLSVLATTLIDADLLIILSDVEGLYEDEPTPESEPLYEVKKVNQKIKQMAGGAGKGPATVGGMKTKVEAAETVTQAGTPMIIASGHCQDVLLEITSGKTVGTLFLPCQDEKTIRGRKRWIGYHLLPKGYIQVDNGAKQALLNRGTSLLPSGVVKASGRFDRGDTVKVIDNSGNEFARGLSNYSCPDVNALKGCQTDEISDILGQHYFDEIIHRDNMVVFPK